ncbi:amidohydrolase family-domain-containing protein [Haematococcus lacustris]
MASNISFVGRCVLAVCTAVALGALLWPSEWMPLHLMTPLQLAGNSSSCPMGFKGTGWLPPGHPPVHSDVPPSHQGHLLLFWNGSVWTADRQGLNAEALLIHSMQGHVLGTGTMPEMQALAQQEINLARSQGISLEVKTYDLEGKFVMPGFVDPHTHFLTAGLFLNNVNVREATSLEVFQHIVAAQVAKLEEQEAEHNSLLPPSSDPVPLQWIQGGQWAEQTWGGQLPHRHWLDAVTGPNRPALLSRMDSHMAIVNTAALRLANITSETLDPAGGIIDRDEDGHPTGVLRENAIGLVARLIPPPTPLQLLAALQGASSYALARGVTTLSCLGRAPFSGNLNTTWEDFMSVMLPAADAGHLRVRLFAFMPLQQWPRLAALVKTNGRAHPGGHLFWGGVKEFADGSLGSHTALMWEPYNDYQVEGTTSLHDQPGVADHEWGTRMISLPALKEAVQGADGAGLHVAVHAIGDRSVDEVADIYGEVLTSRQPWLQAPNNVSINVSSSTVHVVLPEEIGAGMAPRHRIEHAQHLSGPGAASKLASFGIISTPNPLHLVADGPLLVSRLGEKRAGVSHSYAFNTMAKAGAAMGLASDWPVTDLHPIASVYTSMHRRDALDPGAPVYTAEEALSPEEALLGHTVDAAHATMLEQFVGTLRPGLRADFIILDQSPLAMPAEVGGGRGLPSVLHTFVDGVCVYGCA